jgi:hypothetical protein
MDSADEYSRGFVSKLNEIVSSRDDIINISAGISVSDTGANPVLVIDVSDGKELLTWAGSEYKSYNNNQTGINTVYLSSLLNGININKHPNAVVKIYIWNRTKNQLYISGIKIEVIKGSHIIYGLYEPIEKN